MTSIAVALVAGSPQRAAVFRHSVGHDRPPRVRCPACARRLLPERAGEWPALWPTGRCPNCAAPIGPPPLSVELITALLLLSLAAETASPGELAAFGWLAVLAVPLAFVDLAVYRLPDRLTLPAYAGFIALLSVTALTEQRSGDLARAVLGGLVLGAFYLLLFLVNPAGVGLGDAKLALALGSAMGWLGWTHLLTGTFLTYLLGGLYGVLLIALRRAHRKTEIPFGPFMIIGAFGAVLVGAGL